MYDFSLEIGEQIPTSAFELPFNPFQGVDVFISDITYETILGVANTKTFHLEIVYNASTPPVASDIKLYEGIGSSCGIFELTDFEHYSELIEYHTLSLTNIEKEDESIIIAPNPFNDYITIQSNKEITNINIYALSGKLIQSKTISVRQDSNQMNLQSLNTGVYFVEVIDEITNNKTKIKIIKK